MFRVEEHVFIESGVTRMHAGIAATVGIGEIGRIVGGELPLAGNQRVVAETTHDVAERARALRQDAERFPIPVVVFAGHDLHPGGGAEGLGIGVGEADTLLRQLVNMGCGVGLSAVATESFDANIVGHDQEDIARLGRFLVLSGGAD